MDGSTAENLVRQIYGKGGDAVTTGENMIILEVTSEFLGTLLRHCGSRNFFNQYPGEPP